MFSYYGSKSKIVKYYPYPKHDTLIEPFCGSARYALKHFDRNVIICDKYDVVVRIWKYLQKCSEKDILGLPALKIGDDISKYDISEDERLFLGMLAGVASVSPRNKVSAFAALQNGRKNRLKRISDQLFKIRHWDIRHCGYDEIDNVKATWFIDAPYQFGGNGYKHGDIDFVKLKQYCASRNGQVIVCENTKADWMDFKPLVRHVGAMSTTTEAIWTNYELPRLQQTSMFDIQH